MTEQTKPDQCPDCGGQHWEGRRCNLTGGLQTGDVITPSGVVRPFVDLGPTKPDLLDEEALCEIEALLAKIPDGPWLTERSLSWALRELADGYISSNERNGFNRQAYRVLGAVVSDAATSMRDKCVEKVKELRESRLKLSREEGDPLWNVQASALKLAVDALSSLTPDQVEKKQS